MRHIIHVDGRPIVHAHHQVTDIVYGFQQRSGLYRNGDVVAGYPGFLAGRVAGIERIRDVLGSESIPRQQRRIKQDVHPVRYAAEGIDVPGTGHALEGHFEHVCQPGEFLPGMGVGGIKQGQAHHRHIVYTPGLDQGLGGSEIRRQPVLVGIHLVVEPHQCFLSGDTDLEFNGHHRLALS